ncbi:hypothetical protein EYF80_065948 [Liparis tanakae]|uniref:Uncharacterized protein n=1 Tax=Liparis tanakae TaxID=230148 RepID=A0A4Z2E588_9TELE|nr:hypothetical protein EYF80_065948 [Liparis tanakae]
MKRTLQGPSSPPRSPPTFLPSDHERNYHKGEKARSQLPSITSHYVSLKATGSTGDLVVLDLRPVMNMVLERGDF